MARGMLTDNAKDISRSFLDREITCRELRLYPYLDFTIKNSQRIDPNKINSEERKILSVLRAEGHIEGGASGLSMTREFYDYMQDILFETCVDA